MNVKQKLFPGRVEGKLVVITGGGSGIGRAASILLAEHGATVLVTDIDYRSAKETVDLIECFSSKAHALKHDVSNETDWNVVVDLALEQYGHLDVLVNNAGTGIEGECRYTSLSDWQAVMHVNLDGVFLGVRSAINAMIATAKPGDKPKSIINISSTYGLIGGGLASYSASKGGVTLLTKSTASECAQKGYNIRVNSLHPGGVNTPLANLQEDSREKKEELKSYYSKVPMGRCAEPIEIAQGILFLASDESSYMTGSELVIDGGYTAV